MLNCSVAQNTGRCKIKIYCTVNPYGNCHSPVRNAAKVNESLSLCVRTQASEFYEGPKLGVKKGPEKGNPWNLGSVEISEGVVPLSSCKAGAAPVRGCKNPRRPGSLARGPISSRGVKQKYIPKNRYHTLISCKVGAAPVKKWNRKRGPVGLARCPSSA